MEEKLNPNRRIAALATLLLASMPAANAQGYPGGGGAGGMSRTHGNRPDRTEETEHPRDPMLQPHPLAVFANSLERELPAMSLSPVASAAVTDFVRELKDLAALDDRHVHERIGWSRSAVHANVDLGRDLAGVEEGAHEFDAAANDVIARWKKLSALLSDAQRDRVQGVYSSALIDARQPPRDKPAR